MGKNRLSQRRGACWLFVLAMFAQGLFFASQNGTAVANTKLNGGLTSGGQVVSYKMSEDSRWVA